MCCRRYSDSFVTACILSILSARNGVLFRQYINVFANMAYIYSDRCYYGNSCHGTTLAAAAAERIGLKSNASGLAVVYSFATQKTHIACDHVCLIILYSVSSV